MEKIQGLLNELLSFLEDELSIVTGSYQDLLTLDDVLNNDLILFVSLNANRNQRAVEALGKILLQNIQLMVGKRYAQPAGDRDADEPMLSVILDEFAPFAYPGFTQVLQTARGARVSFLFSFQSMPQLQRVSQAFADEVSSAPGTKMIMNVSEENTSQWFLKASARIATKRRSLSVRRTGIFSTKYTETGTGSESDIKETRAREDHIKNLPVGQMEVLMVDNREGTRYSHLHVRRAPRFELEGIKPSLYPMMHSYLDKGVGVNLRFKEAENRKQRRRRTAGIFLGGAAGRVTMRSRVIIGLVVIIVMLGCLYGHSFGQTPNQQSSATTHPAPKREGFFDYAVGKINPQGRDYGATIESVRSAIVDNSVDDLYFWSNVVTLTLLCGLAAIVLLQWRAADKREVIAASLIAQLWNGRVSDRIEIERRTGQYSRLVETHNAEAERTLVQKSQGSESAKDADVSRSVRKLAGKSAAGNGATQLRLNMETAAEAGSGEGADLEQSNLLLQRRVEALQNSEQNLKQRLNQTTVLLDQERRRNAALKGA